MDNLILTDILYNNRLYYQMMHRWFELEEKKSQNTYNLSYQLLNRRPRRIRTPVSNSTQTPASNTSVTDIINNTTLLSYSDISTNHTICPISREIFESSDIVLKINNCGHIFKRLSLLNWLANNNTCPSCRALLSNNANPMPRFHTISNPLANPIMNPIMNPITNPVSRIFSNLHLS